MTPQEQQMIDGLVQRIASTPVVDKDLEADHYLQRSLAGTPDAIYVLAQTVLVQQYGLQQAKDQIADLQAQLQAQQAPQPSSGGSFLSHLFGSGSSSQAAPPPPAYQPVANPGARPAYSAFGGQSATPPAYAQPMMYPPAPVYAAPSAGGGFLRGALQTAAGVAAGEVAFAGMESLFHGFGGGGYGGGMGGFGGGFEGGPREEIVNNYYGDSDRGGKDRGEPGRDDDSMNYDSSAPDTGFDSSSSDTGFDNGSNDTGFDSGDSGGGDDGSSY